MLKYGGHLNGYQAMCYSLIKFKRKVRSSFQFRSNEVNQNGFKKIVRKQRLGKSLNP